MPAAVILVVAVIAGVLGSPPTSARAQTAPGALAPPGPPGPPVPDNCVRPGKEGGEFARTPWPQQMWHPERAWPLSDGSGVIVAVISSGVDARHPQLAHRVRPGRDFLDPSGTRPADTDCAGLGTQIAGVIAAGKEDDTGFHGAAPGVRILPVRVGDGIEVAVPAGSAAGFGSPTADALTFAFAIIAAVQAGARVIAVGVVTGTDHQPIRDAIKYAVADNVVVVAPASTAGLSQTTDPQPGAPEPRPYPAAYPGVIGVGAIGPDGSPWPDPPPSRDAEYVDLVAPGTGPDLISTQGVRGYAPAEGTAIATGFVSAAAALVRSRWPALSAHDVARRLVATARPAPFGADRRVNGAGVVDPYHAVADELATGAPASLPGFTMARPDPEQVAEEAAWAASLRGALVLAAGGVLAMVAVVVAKVAVARGRRRRWQPVLAADPDRPSSLDQENVAPPRPLFDPDAAAP